MSTAIVSQFISVDDVAAELGISPNSVYLLVNSGKMAAHQFGVRNGAIRVHRKDLDAYIEASRVRPGDAASPPPAPAKKRGAKK